MARLLFREFITIMDGVGTEDDEIRYIRFQNFDGWYKRCSIDTQGEFHEMVARYMKEI